MHLNSEHRPAQTVSLVAVKTERNTNPLTNQSIAIFLQRSFAFKGVWRQSLRNVGEGMRSSKSPGLE